MAEVSLGVKLHCTRDSFFLPAASFSSFTSFFLSNSRLQVSVLFYFSRKYQNPNDWRLRSAIWLIETEINVPIVAGQYPQCLSVLGLNYYLQMSLAHF